ncbi:hypothetical protein WN51_12866 [Melipona quadrifasciata]|uniref:Uncharacterized protein n=1 Tax=Melipona quadrifasciata TaxID=166423 RepID=A0A0M9A316_9HYME|nr:hypothetical protein WN51_12866 [Melipona quadrifasciata]
MRKRSYLEIQDQGAIAQYQTTPLLLEVYPTPPDESREPNQPIANFRCISVAPEEARFSRLSPLKSLLVIKNNHFKSQNIETLRAEKHSRCLLLPKLSIKQSTCTAGFLENVQYAKIYDMCISMFNAKHKLFYGIIMELRFYVLGLKQRDQKCLFDIIHVMLWEFKQRKNAMGTSKKICSVCGSLINKCMENESVSLSQGTNRDREDRIIIIDDDVLRTMTKNKQTLTSIDGCKHAWSSPNNNVGPRII